MGDGAERRARDDPHGALAVARARRERMPAAAARADVRGSGRHLVELGSGAALPFALQAIYLVCLPIAAREGVGSVTSFGYAYLIAAAVVGISASSVRLVTAVPLTGSVSSRGVSRGTSRRRLGRRCSSSRRRRIFAVAGASIAARVLGPAYGDDVGAQIARLVVAMAPYMVASVALSVTFPLVFVAGRGARLPLVGAAVLAIHVPLAFAGQALAGNDGCGRARRLDRRRFRLDAHVLPRGPLDDPPARAGDRCRSRLRGRGLRPGGRAPRPGGSCGGGAGARGARARPPVGLRSAWHYLRELA